MSGSDDELRSPLKVTFRDLCPENEAELRRLNAVIFPIRYSVSHPSPRPRHSLPSDDRNHRKANVFFSSPVPHTFSPSSPPTQDKFYVECAAAGRVTQLAYIDSELVGAIACRLELTPDRSGARMYIMTVGVLAGFDKATRVFFAFSFCLSSLLPRPSSHRVTRLRQSHDDRGTAVHSCAADDAKQPLTRVFPQSVLSSGVPDPKAPYRNGAIGTRLLQHALNEGSTDPFIVDAYLHVQVSNDDAKAFYERFGFVTDHVVQNYYKRLDPPDAVILKLDLKQWKVGVGPFFYLFSFLFLMFPLFFFTSQARPWIK